MYFCRGHCWLEERVQLSPCGSGAAHARVMPCRDEAVFASPMASWHALPVSAGHVQPHSAHPVDEGKDDASGGAQEVGVVEDL